MMRKRQARELPSSSTKIRSIIQLDQADGEGVQWVVCHNGGWLSQMWGEEEVTRVIV